MKRIILIAAMVLGFAVAANASSYSVDNASIDALFAEAEMVAPATPATPTVAPAMDGQTKTIVAFVIDTIGLGGLGIHRLVLGTRPINVLLYFITFGGIFGIIPLVDWVMLLIDIIQGGASYLDNPAFIMWI